MPTALSHPAVPLALRLAGGPRVVSPRLLVAGALASVVPDLDAIGFWAGVPYGHPLGHRGFSHSLTFALLLGAMAAMTAGALRASRAAAFAVVSLSAASHGVLDMFTDGGLGVALLSPFSHERFFAPWRPIQVSPLSVSGFLDGPALPILASEVAFVWLPALLFGVVGLVVRRRKGAR